MPLAPSAPEVKRILITGGSGMIGKRLSDLLLKRGYEVSLLGRSKKVKGFETFIWDPERMDIDTGSISKAHAIIHLAGAGVADKRWNARRKNEILRSRTDSTMLLKETLETVPNNVKIFVSASGIGYYGLEEPGHELQEEDPPGSDFMASVTLAWEKEADRIKELGLRVVKIRMGVVLSASGGALQKLAAPVNYFVGAPLGSGKQSVNWIHIDDACRIFVKAVEDSSMEGAYNAVAPIPVTNKKMTEAIAKALNRPLWLPPVPGFVVRMLAGEVAEIVLKGGKVSGEKVKDAGFEFQFERIEDALKNLLNAKE
jgi:uncharacterized protein (TIGR01777 family)